MLAIRPLHDHVYVRRHPSPEFDGHIAIPSKARERPRFATVISVGPGSRDSDTGHRVPIEIQAGDYVLIDKWAGHVIGQDGPDELVMISASDLHALFPRDVPNAS